MITKQFSWFNPNGSLRSTIGFWLVSNNFSTNVLKVSIEAPWTDYALTFLELKTFKRNEGYWKFSAIFIT